MLILISDSEGFSEALLSVFLSVNWPKVPRTSSGHVLGSYPRISRYGLGLFGPAWDKLCGFFLLITQRSKVQILPPQPSFSSAERTLGVAVIGRHDRI